MKPATIDRELLTQRKSTHDYAKKRAALMNSRQVSKAQAMKQILRHSKEARENVYRTMQFIEDGKLILKPSPKKWKNGTS